MNDCFCSESHVEMGFPISLGCSRSVGPEYLGELFGLEALGMIELFLERFLDELVDGLDLVICLWMCRGGIE